MLYIYTSLFLLFALAGQVAANSQGPSDGDPEVFPQRNKPGKKGHPRKRINILDQSLEKMKSAMKEERLNHDIPETPETTPSGRPKRRAAKV